MKDNQQPSLECKELKEDSDYLIYNDGRIFSKKTNRFLTGKIDSVGYRVYGLAFTEELTVSRNKKSKMLYARRVVAGSFIPNPNNYQYVHHKDENKLNNCVSNLEWVSPKQNMQYHLHNNKAKKRKKTRYHIDNLPNERWLIIPNNKL